MTQETPGSGGCQPTGTTPPQRFDCDGTDNIVCPFCGYEHDPTDFGGRPGSHSCDECQKPFRYEADYSVTYSTSCLHLLHEFGEWKIVRGTTARFCLRCGACELQPERNDACQKA